MCGRYFLLVKLNELKKRYGIEAADIDYHPPGEVFPTHRVPVIVENEKDNKRNIEKFKWGFSPSFTNNSIINARAETIADKNLFKNPFQEKRCIIPANLFYEWKDTASNKVKYEIGIKDREIISLAGIYNTFKDNNGDKIDCFTIITTNPSKKISRIHSRMPVILTDDGEDKWLISNNNNNIEKLKELLTPYQDEKIEIDRADNSQSEQLELPF